MADNSKTSFGLGQISNKTPEWANWIFRGYFIVSKALVGYIAALAALKSLNISLVSLTVTVLTINLLLDPIVYGFSKLFGIVPEEADPGKPVIADTQVTDDGGTKSINPVIIDPPIPVPDVPHLVPID